LDPERFYTLAMHTNGMDEPMKVADLVNENNKGWDEDLVCFFLTG
jgi:hypothetical protein